MLQAERFLITNVQKRAPKGQEPAVWVHELTPAQLGKGRKKYDKLLRCYAQQSVAVAA